MTNGDNSIPDWANSGSYWKTANPSSGSHETAATSRPQRLIDASVEGSAMVYFFVPHSHCLVFFVGLVELDR